MKKIVIVIAIMAITVIGTAIFFACKKENNVVEKQETSVIKQQKKITNAQLLAAIRAVGIAVEIGKTYTVQYREGYFYHKEVKVLFGLLYSSIETGCRPGDAVCDLVHVWEKGGRLLFSPPVIEKDKNGLASLTKISSPQNECFEGYLCVISKGVVSDKKTLIFLTDITKVIHQEWYDSDFFHVKHPFAIEPEICYDAEILPKNQIVPIGNYPLYKEGNLRFWYIEIE
jgi:hypothetical protein